MMEEWATGHVIESLRARRELDMANGILVALRRCGPDAALRELLGAAKRHGYRSWPWRPTVLGDEGQP